MSVRHRQVLVNNALVGILRKGNDLWPFEYAQEWMSAARVFDLSPMACWRRCRAKPPR